MDMNNKNENGRPDVLFAVMKLTRSIRRCPPGHEHGHGHGPGHGHGHGFHPGMGHAMDILAANEGVSSRELAELLDIRPSSLTELLTRLESEGIVARTPDENDRRVTRVSLTDKGRELAAEMNAEHEQRKAKASACFTDEEAAMFCEMCERLGAHLEGIAKEDGNLLPPPDFRHGPCAGFPGEGFGGGHLHRFPPRHRKLR